MANLKWYAAFHDKKTNPHVHIIVYSTNEREGFLTNHGIEKIRSGFANDIYSDELHHLYAQQTDLRNLLKADAKTLMKSLAEELKYDDCGDDELCKLIFQLHSQLKSSKGKKVYGYMKTDIKKTVDDIFNLKRGLRSKLLVYLEREPNAPFKYIRNVNQQKYERGAHNNGNKTRYKN